MLRLLLGICFIEQDLMEEKKLAKFWTSAVINIESNDSFSAQDWNQYKRLFE